MMVPSHVQNKRFNTHNDPESPRGTMITPHDHGLRDLRIMYDHSWSGRNEAIRHVHLLKRECDGLLASREHGEIS